MQGWYAVPLRQTLKLNCDIRVVTNLHCMGFTPLKRGTEEAHRPIAEA